MKLSHIFTVAALVLGVVGAHGEELDFFQRGPASRFIETEVHAIAGTATVMSNYKGCFPQIENLRTNMGHALGVGGRGVLGLRDYLGFGTEINLIHSSYTMDMAVVSPETQTMSAVYLDNDMWYVNIPVFVSFRFNVARSVRWSVDGGAYYAFGFAGKQRQVLYRGSVNALDELVMEKLDVKTDYFHSGTTFQNVFLRGDIGVYIGTSLNFGPHLVVGCRAQIGVKNTASTPNGVEHPYVRNVSFAGSVGYRF
ncbi:MAG: PorT family protein [Paramuribaculum sp.]|nr:PorT family protein [Paramuribaculum sp.]